jgi:3-dehydroquinate synthase
MLQTMKIAIPGSGAKTYPIFVDSGLLSKMDEVIPSALASFRSFLVTDRNLVEHGYAATLGIEPSASYVIDPPGETSKHIETVTNIINTMDERGFGRDTIVLALGGGTVGDIAGLAASVFKRGVPVIQIPTTTVAQADSAIGGKTGVNSHWSKNAIGTFWNPRAIVIDVRTLETLDERHYLSGLAESVKHGLIADPSFFDWLTDQAMALKQREPKTLAELAQRNARIKGVIVEQDPKEQTGFRFALNFGHTIGHAIETVSDFRVRHGEGVAVGMIGALRLGVLLGVTPERLVECVETLLRKLGLPVRLPPNIEPDDLLNSMARDKKVKAGRARFVLLKETGEVLVRQDAYAHTVDAQQLLRVCRSLREA